MVWLDAIGTSMLLWYSWVHSFITIIPYYHILPYLAHLGIRSSLSLLAMTWGHLHKPSTSGRNSCTSNPCLQGKSAPLKQSIYWKRKCHFELIKLISGKPSFFLLLVKKESSVKLVRKSYFVDLSFNFVPFLCNFYRV